jgi:hypothetical protein
MSMTVLFKFATVVTSWIFLKFSPVQGFQIRSQSCLMYPRQTCNGKAWLVCCCRSRLFLSTLGIFLYWTMSTCSDRMSCLRLGILLRQQLRFRRRRVA